jgi:hypothetical protein
VIAGFAVHEGIEAWRGDACCAPVSVLTGDSADPGPGPSESGGGDDGCDGNCSCCAQ